MENLVRIKFGSYLYGTNTPESDLDLKSVFLPNARDILLQKAPRSINITRKKAFGEKNNLQDIDDEGVSLHQYLNLVSEGQTVALDMLFSPDWSLLEPPSYLWKEIFKNREKICNKKSASFVGYCRTQANKYGIKGSRIRAVKATIKTLESAKELYGGSRKLESISKDLEALIEAEDSPHIKIVSLVQKNRLEPVTHLECCGRKIPYFSTIKVALEVYSLVLKNYGERAFLTEKNEGIDWKALSHAVRVGREALEFLEDCFITFPRPEAKHLLKIKLGEISYNKVAEEIEELLVRVEEASKNSSLPEAPSRKWIDDFVADAYKDVIIKFYI